jgi:hypothetical protein
MPLNCKMRVEKSSLHAFFILKSIRLQIINKDED